MILLRVQDISESRDFNQSQFPVALGISEQGLFSCGDAAEPAPVAWLGYASGHVFIEGVDGFTELEINDIAISSSVWLSSDDRIRLGATLIEVSESNGVIILSPKDPQPLPALTPPAMPPSTPQTDENQSQPQTPSQVDDDFSESAKDAQTQLSSPAELIEPEQTEQTGQTGQTGQTDKVENPEQVTDPFLPTAPAPVPSSHPWYRRVLIGLLLLAFLGVGFVLVATPVQVSVAPNPDTMAFTGGLPPIKVGERFLVLPGTYQVFAKKNGYHELNQSILVEIGTEPVLEYQLKKLPGFLTVNTNPDQGVKILIDGQQASEGPLEKFEIEAGAHRIQVEADRYQPAEQLIEVQGMGREQILQITLDPGWGTYGIRSEPQGADLWLDGKVVGVTPIEILPMAGKHQLELRKAGWQNINHDLNVKANEAVELPVFLLQQANGALEVTTTPSGASVTVAGKFQGRSPLALTLAPDRKHELRFSKAGFKSASRSVSVEADGQHQLAVRLRAEYGVVFIISRPADAELRIDGQLKGKASQRLRLTTRTHRVEISRQGYDSYTGSVTPTPGASKRLEVRLTRKRKNQPEANPAKIKTPVGQLLQKIHIDSPVRIQMGSSRGEQGRRSNESKHSAELTRTFYISTKEVTNAEYMEFRANHRSGDYVGMDLSGAEQPVVSVAWNDAARYANWLSEKENLPPVYREQDGEMIAMVPLSSGYRLPTEAEWVFVSRYADYSRGKAKPIRYPWGKGWPPPDGTGNFADSSAAGQLPITLQTYTDGHVVSAPVGQYPPNTLGIYDLGGNTSEWVHDYYDAYLGTGSRVPQDPYGPASGRHHVIRGASWKHGSITELRLSYRDYADKPRIDVGFRVARYAKNSSK